MGFPQMVLLSALFASAAAAKWEAYYYLGRAPVNQPMHMIIDVSSDEALVAKAAMDDGSYRLSGYVENISKDYKTFNRTLHKTFSTPAYYNNVTVWGEYVGDHLFPAGDDDDDDDDYTQGVDVIFGLFGKTEGAERLNRIGMLYSGFAGLGRKTPGGFKKGILYKGNTYCAATECEYVEGYGSICDQITFCSNRSGAEAFHRYYKDAIHYTDVKPNPSNEVGWTFDVQRFRFGHLSVNRPFQITLSTTSEFLTVPESVASYIVKTLKAVWFEPERVYLVEENVVLTADPIVFVINGKEIPVKPVDYITRMYSQTAILKIQESADGSWTVGEPFTDSVGVCLDFDKDLASFHSVPVLSNIPSYPDAFKNSSTAKPRRLPNGLLYKRTVVPY